MENHTYMALNYSEELLKWSKGGGETRVVQLHSFPQVISTTLHVCAQHAHVHVCMHTASVCCIACAHTHTHTQHTIHTP